MAGDQAVVRRKDEWIARWRFAVGVATPTLEAFAPLTVRGARLPEGAFILAPNHMTDVDPVVMGVAMGKLGRVPRFLAKASLFKVPLLGNALRWLGQIPVERTPRRDPGAGATALGAKPHAKASAKAVARREDPLQAANMLIERGWAVIIYPEGTLTRQPELWPMRGRTGAVRTAIEAGIPIVPAAHWGDQEVMPRWSKRVRLLPRHPVEVLIGEPFDLTPWADAPRTHATYKAATEALMHEITRLVAELRGEEPPAELWDPTEHGQTEFGRP